MNEKFVVVAIILSLLIMDTLSLNIRAEVRQRRYTSKWTCMHWGKVVGEVEIWWGHTAGDGG
jgi:hypothetical protein